ncbi:sulfatase-like hydrolase/transferase [Lentisphaerae bacterium WC36]|nr:sulfatase-like hydrolase/transferase [Lentisphaerae bacterium WC36]
MFAKTNLKPNIIILFADDQKWNTINALGNNNIITPNLDKLTKQSVVFSNGFCFGGNTGAVCIPARNMLMTGKTFFRFEEEQRAFQKQGLKRPYKSYYANPNWNTMPKSMKALGYETYFDEKSGWANNPIIRKQFDYFHDIDMPKELATGRAAKNIVDDAINYLTVKRDKSKPFFMYLGIPAPHDPRWSGKKFRDMYNIKNMVLPVNYLPQHPYNIGDMFIRDESLEKWPRTKDAIKRHLFDYYSLITAMDYDLGRLIDKLDTLNLRKNTIIIYSSDQGLAIGSKGLMGKQNIYDATMKVPFLISIPNVKHHTNNSFVYTHDIYPTIVDLANGKLPNNLDGKSLKPIIYQKQQKVRNNLMLAYKNYQRALNDGEWKIMVFPHINKIELYNIKNDPYEIQDLANKPKYAKIIEKMLLKLKSEQKIYGDISPLKVEKPQEAQFIVPKNKNKTRKWGPYPAGGLAPNDITQP